MTTNECQLIKVVRTKTLITIKIDWFLAADAGAEVSWCQGVGVWLQQQKIM